MEHGDVSEQLVMGALVHLLGEDAVRYLAVLSSYPRAEVTRWKKVFAGLHGFSFITGKSESALC